MNAGRKLFWLLALACMGLVLPSCAGMGKLAPYTADGEKPKRKEIRELRQKYTEQTGLKVTRRRLPMFVYIDGWMGCPYRYGGQTRTGTDCSGFVLNVYRDVYGLALPRSSHGQYQATKRKKMRRLRQGDFVFFNFSSDGKPSHVGIYLGNRRFVHASTSRGVTIDTLGKGYFSQHFLSGGSKKKLAKKAGQAKK